jgi:hypothetical protein
MMSPCRSAADRVTRCAIVADLLSLTVTTGE